ncbi:RNA polymerase sigma factor [Streptomyces sp. NPDC060064]|uniref:RNA polymerase sigma factor n=1 Tax=Streptomyces sp. NPDC060064 TaxID=3347049 RepID=UPI00367F3A03
MDRIDVRSTKPQAVRLSAEAADRLDRLFRLYNIRLLGFASTRVRNRDIAAAEDIVSETWLRAAVSLSQLKAADAQAYGWLCAIAFRAAVDYYRPRRALPDEPRLVRQQVREAVTVVALFRRSEKAADDFARTGRLLEGLEAAYAARTGSPTADLPLTDFEDVVIEGAMPLAGETYPPAGHTYPRKG